MTIQSMQLPRYDRQQTYQWNYDHAPDPVKIEVPEFQGNWKFCGLDVDSPLGVPAGPLLNGKWCLYAASLGFDVLTYKTVRSKSRECYPLPNLQPVCSGTLLGGERSVPATGTMAGSWAVSYGMPSKKPDIWRADVEQTRRKLPTGKLLSVSVVGTIQEGWTIDDLAGDYAQCAKWAVESGADCVETNFSCPNVSTCDGQLFQQPTESAVVASRVRETIGEIPYICKIGHLTRREDAEALIASMGSIVDSFAMTNSVAVTVVDDEGRLMFDGQQRGICGGAIRNASITQVQMFTEIIRRRGLELQLIGVGGASSAEHVEQYLSAGAHAVHIATASMVDPSVAIQIRESLAGKAIRSRHA